MHRRTVLSCLLGAVPWAAGDARAQAGRPVSVTALPGARLVGEGTFRWFGLRVYAARLFATDGRYRPDAPHLLELTYDVAIASERFVEASLDELKRLAGEALDTAAAARWRAELARALPDVRAGDTLSALHRPGQGVTFFQGAQLRAAVDDAALAAAFLGVWLDPRTRDPVLRRRLLGIGT